ncbi:MAG: hypothetical protein PHF37_01460 [Phycisphaerae bacterium]|nr:hypothetical protein [Phycisphaerae bacterium]
MKKIVSAAFLWAICMTLVCVPANATVDLVSTTFEPNSAGEGTWPGDSTWGDGNDIDPASGASWEVFQISDAGNIPTDLRVITGADVYAGSQSGRIRRTSTAGMGPMTALFFGGGRNTRTLTLNWFQKLKQTGSFATEYVGLMIGDEGVGDPGAAAGDPNRVGSWENMALGILMKVSGAGLTNIQLNDADAARASGTKELLSSYQDDTWYEINIVLDFATKQYTANIKQAGAPVWASTVSGYFRKGLHGEEQESFGWITCKTSATGVDGFWDNITVTADCAGWYEGDLNGDCYVNFKDFANIANQWMDCTAPTDPVCIDLL